MAVLLVTVKLQSTEDREALEENIRNLHNYPQDSQKDAARYLSKVRKIASNRR